MMANIDLLTYLKIYMESLTVRPSSAWAYPYGSHLVRSSPPRTSSYQGMETPPA